MGEIDSLFRRLRDAWHDIAGSSSGSGGVSPDLSSDGNISRLREQMAACLEARGGEVSARGRAAALGRTYLELDLAGRRRFLETLAEAFGPEPAAVDAAVAALDTADNDTRPAAQDRLRQVLDPPRMRLMTQFNALPEGVKFLVDLRSDLIALADTPSLRSLDDELRQLLASWFDVGFLELRRITWNSPASLLEKLIAYEAVHEIRSWDDLKNRLGIAAGVRCHRACEEIFNSERFSALEARGAHRQKLLMASTSTKDPSLPDTMYLTALVAKDSINTIPEATLLAFADHGVVDGVLDQASWAEADRVIAGFETAGVDVAALGEKLQVEGAEAFATSWRHLLESIEAKVGDLQST